MLLAKKSTASRTVTRVRFRSTMCVPPCDAGVNPSPPMPASRPECMRMSDVKPTTMSTWVTARNVSTRSGYPASGDFDDRRHQLGRDAVLRDVTGCASLPRPVDVGARVRAGQHEDADILGRRADLARGFEAIEHRHAHVHQDEIRAQPLRELDRLAAVARLADDLDPVVGGEDRLERLGKEPMVVGYQHAERLGLLRAARHPFILAVSVELWKRTSASGSRSCSSRATTASS